MANRGRFPKRIDTRRAEAKLRNEIRVKRGDAVQLIHLKEKGHGHCKEAARLASKLAPS